MKPLEDVRIIAVEQYGAGPWGSVHLADPGADVIKIEEPSAGGHVGRYLPPFSEGEDSLFFEAFNSNKRSLSLDLSNTHGREVFEQLVRRSDAEYSDLRLDVRAKIGIRLNLSHVLEKIVGYSGEEVAETRQHGAFGWHEDQTVERPAPGAPRSRERGHVAAELADP